MASPRPEIKVMGTSCNPEYNLDSSSSRVKRTEDGRRVAPVSQLNTYAGRDLARRQPVGCVSFSEGIKPIIVAKEVRRTTQSSSVRQPRSVGDLTQSATTLPKRRVSVRQDEIRDAPSRSVAKHTDRKYPISQQPRSELSRLLSMTRGSSRKGTTVGKKLFSNEKKEQRAVGPPCLECGQSRTNQPAGPGRFSHVCCTCHRFVPIVIAALKEVPQPSKASEASENRSTLQYSNRPLCKTCASIPGCLYDEYLQFFPACVACGQMTNMIFTSSVGNNGEIKGLSDDDGNKVFGASKEFRECCVCVAHQLPSISKQSSNKSNVKFFSSTSSASLRRSGALRHSATHSTTPPSMGEQAPKPASALEVRHDTASSTPRFSFRPIEKPRRVYQDGLEDITELLLDSPVQSAQLASPSSNDANTESNFPDDGSSICGTTAKYLSSLGGVKVTFEEILGDLPAIERPIQELRRQPGIYPWSRYDSKDNELDSGSESLMQGLRQYAEMQNSDLEPVHLNISLHQHTY